MASKFGSWQLITYGKQKHLGCKKRWGQSEAAIIWLYIWLNALISAKAKI